jgi:hypothetical protein
MCHLQSAFQTLKKLPARVQVRLGNTTIIFAEFHSTVMVQDLAIDTVLLPQFHVSLLLVSRLNAFQVIFREMACAVVKSGPGQFVWLAGILRSGLYHLAGATRSESAAANFAIRITSGSEPHPIELWHRCFGHLNNTAPRYLTDVKRRSRKTTDLENLCKTCIMSK